MPNTTLRGKFNPFGTSQRRVLTGTQLHQPPFVQQKPVYTADGKRDKLRKVAYIANELIGRLEACYVLLKNVSEITKKIRHNEGGQTTPPLVA